MQLFYREIKAYRKSLMVWCGIALLLIIAGMGKYGGFTADAGQLMNEIMADMPKSLQAIMGVGTLDLATAIGYFGMLYLYLLLLATIHAVMLGSTIIVKEERDQTAEFLFAKPISRTRAISSKLTAAVVQIVLLHLMMWMTSWITLARLADSNTFIVDLTRLMFGMLLLQFLFLFVGTAIAAVCKRPKRAGGIAAAVLLTTFILSILIDISGKIDVLKFVTPFKYFDAKDVISQNGYNGTMVILTLGLSLGLLILTYVSYQKRDFQI